MTIPEQAVEAVREVYRRWGVGGHAGPDKLIRAAITAAQSHMGVQRPEDVATDTRRVLENLKAFIGVMFGRGADAHIPETVSTAIGVPIKLGQIMRDLDAVLSLPHTGQPQERQSVTVGMVTAALAAVGEHDVPLASNRRRQVTKMIQAAVDWQSSRAAPASPRAEGEDSLRERALKIIADEEAFAAKDEPGNIQLHALRVARVGTAKQILGLIRMSDAVIAEKREKS